MGEKSEKPMISEMKRKIAAGYEVEAELVAREILRKRRLVRWARQALVSAPGRSRKRPARGR